MCHALHYWIDTPSKSHPSLGFGWASILYIKFILNDWLVVVLVEIAHLHEHFADIDIYKNKENNDKYGCQNNCLHTHKHSLYFIFIPSISGVVDIVWTKVFQVQLKVLKEGTKHIHQITILHKYHYCNNKHENQNSTPSRLQNDQIIHSFCLFVFFSNFFLGGGRGVVVYFVCLLVCCCLRVCVCVFLLFFFGGGGGEGFTPFL